MRRQEFVKSLALAVRPVKPLFHGGNPGFCVETRKSGPTTLLFSGKTVHEPEGTKRQLV